jgi:hypothetical protein
VTWPTFPTFPDYYSTVARAVEARNSIIYHLWWRQSRAVGCSWVGQYKADPRASCGISHKPCNSYQYVTGEVLRVCRNLAFFWLEMTDCLRVKERLGYLVTVNLRSDCADMPSPLLLSRLNCLPQHKYSTQEHQVPIYKHG